MSDHTHTNSFPLTDPVKSVEELNERFSDGDVDAILRWGWEVFGNKMVIGTGFGPSGAVLMHKTHQLKLPFKVFYLDTNLLFRQTYELRDRYAELFGVLFERVSTGVSLEDQAGQFGEKLWNTNPDKCCHIRKVLPLQNHLKDKQVWVTGVRRDQSASRKKTRLFEWDSLNEVLKLNPLAGWTADDVWLYIKLYDLPYNPLHDHGYPSIGCQPCTKPVADESDERSGRWSGNAKTECGIHVVTQNTSDK
ncbi:MAG: phosphoadenylyl-sulfate reductase [Balneolales bacterium]